MGPSNCNMGMACIGQATDMLVLHRMIAVRMSTPKDNAVRKASRGQLLTALDGILSIVHVLKPASSLVVAWKDQFNEHDSPLAHVHWCETITSPCEFGHPARRAKQSEPWSRMGDNPTSRTQVTPWKKSKHRKPGGKGKQHGKQHGKHRKA